MIDLPIFSYITVCHNGDLVKKCEKILREQAGLKNTYIAIINKDGTRIPFTEDSEIFFFQYCSENETLEKFGNE